MREGDTLLLMLDCERGCLSAYLNGARLGRLLRAPAQLAAQMPLAWMVELREPGDAVQVALRLPPPGAAEAEDAEELLIAAMGEMGGGAPPRGAGAAAGPGGYELDAGTAAAAAAAGARAAGSAASCCCCGGCVCGVVRRLGASAYLLLCGGGAVALLACVAVRAPDAFLFDATVLAHLGAGSSHHPHPRQRQPPPLLRHPCAKDGAVARASTCV
eukprot:COSAG01_NODE_647_length_14531_cov_61.773489_14_plen_215_part_00